MEKHNLRRVIATASLVLGLSSVWSAHADTFDETLGDAAGATDVYSMNCPIGTVNVQAEVNDLNSLNNEGKQVSVHVINPHGRAATESAPDDGFFSDLATLGGGAGNYLVIVDKDAAGGEEYTLFTDCYNAGNVASVGIQSVLVQDQ